jgi:uncharacterized protein (TIGR02145 family)
MKTSLSLIFLLSVSISIAQQTGTITDARDGKTYKTVVIGTQTWMAENLNVSSFRNGDLILEAKSKEEWIAADENKQPAWCYYNNDTANGRIYGKLYNFFAVNDPRGLAPESWHISTYEEWNEIMNYFGGVSEAGIKLKSDNGWKENYNGTNESGFSGIPGGNRDSDGIFNGIHNFGEWYLFTLGGAVSNRLNKWNYGSYNIKYYNFPKAVGLSVRCIKN